MDTLPACISNALSPDVAEDVSEACFVQGLTIESIAAEQTVDGLADRLFLTKDESSCFISVCRNSLATMVKGDDVNVEGVPCIMVMGEEVHEPLPSAGQDNNRSMAPTAQVETPLATAPKQEPETLPLPPPVLCEAPVITPEKSAAPTSAGKGATRTPNTRLATSQVLLPGDLMRSSQHLQDKGVGANIPSYLRPTTAHRARAVSKEDVKASPRATCLASPRATCLASPRSTTLFSPTASHLARASATRLETSSSMTYRGRGDAHLRMSVPAGLLSATLQLPQGQRVTKAEPFDLSVSWRGDKVMSTEDIDMAEAKAHAFKSTQVPKNLFSPLSTTLTKSTPKNPQDIFKPFQLASLTRHAKFQEAKGEELKKKQDEEQRERIFKATSLDKRMIEKALTPPKPEPKPATVPDEVHFKSEQRCQVHKEVLTPSKYARIAALEKAREERRRKEQEDEEEAAKLKAEEEEELRRLEEEAERKAVAEHRKSLTFKARQMPNFQSPFSPDLSKSQPVTLPKEFKLAVDQRPKAKSPSPSPRDPGNSIQFDADGNLCLRKCASMAHPLRSSHDSFCSMRRASMGNGSMSALRKSSSNISQILSLSAIRRSPSAAKQGAEAAASPSTAQRAAQSAAELRKALADAMESVSMCGL